MVLHTLTLYPTGELDSARTDLLGLDHTSIKMLEPVLNGELSFTGPLPDAPDISVKWNGTPGGQVLITFHYAGKIYFSGALSCGKEPDADLEIMQLYLESMERIVLYKQITERKPNPFSVLEKLPERPLLVGVVWPTIPAETFKTIMGLELLMTVIYLKNLDAKGSSK